jgi:hypothetical protein
MSMFTVHRMVCDSPECDSKIERYKSKDTRDEAKRAQWSRLKNAAGVPCDICPACTDILIGGRAAGGAA